jgi:2-keto-3-deoxy-galactonokinase
VTRLRAWAKRLDDAVLKPDWRPEGIELASPEVQQQILATAYLRQRWTRPPIVAPAADWVSHPEAADLLKSRSAPFPHIVFLVARGLLQAAYRATDGADGVTLSSVAEELRWRKEASLWRRIRRRIGGILHFL